MLALPQLWLGKMNIRHIKIMKADQIFPFPQYLLQQIQINDANTVFRELYESG